jgi:hypothetical protein
MKSIIITLLSVIPYSSFTYAQKPVYTDECELVRQLLDSADRRFFNFGDDTKNASITILDIDSLLTKCAIGKINDVKVVVVNSGSMVEKVRKHDIFSARGSEVQTYVLLKRNVDSMTGYSVYHPRSNGIYSWGVVMKNKRYYFKKKSTGWF